MTTSPANLVEELLHNANASGNRPLERRLADLSVWFYKNHKAIPPENLIARLKFYEKSLWTLIELNALILERVHEMEAVRRGGSRLWLPKGMKVNGENRSATEFS